MKDYRIASRGELKVLAVCVLVCVFTLMAAYASADCGGFWDWLWSW